MRLVDHHAVPDVDADMTVAAVAVTPEEQQITRLEILPLDLDTHLHLIDTPGYPDFSGQSIAALIPAILPIAETAKSSPAEILAAFIIGAEVCGRMSRAAPTISLGS